MSTQLFENSALAVPSYEVKQPKYPNLPRTPCRVCLCSPSGGGKTNLLINLLLYGYAGCFSAIYVFSSSAHIDPSWRPVKKMIAGMGAGAVYDHFDNDTLQAIFDEHAAVVEIQKALPKKPRYIHSICIVADDVIDNPRFKHSRAFETLAIRGRHAGVSFFATAQKLKNHISPVLRVNFSDWFIFAMNSRQELLDILEENSAILPLDRLYAIYNRAMRVRHNHIWINKRDRTIHIGFAPPES
tara:strand:+ start:3504 stop:4229 length:726 start_codon:yes stop_codon:yes gene_type:complete